jgi:hypothetical protein
MLAPGRHAVRHYHRHKQTHRPVLRLLRVARIRETSKKTRQPPNNR